MIDDKTIRQQRNRITAFFICIAMFILPLILFRIRPFMNLLDRLYYLLHEGTGTGASSIVEGEWEYTDSLQKYSWEFSVLLIPSGCSLIGSIVIFFVFRIPKAFRILRMARLTQKGFRQGDEIPASQEDFGEYTLRPDSEARDRRPQNGFTQDFASLFETTARIYDGKETTENIPGEADNTASGSFYILEDLCFLGSEERIV